MKELWDLFQENLVNVQGSYGILDQYLLVAVGSSGILKGKQKIGLTFDSDKLGVIDFTKLSKLTMCSAYELAAASQPASTVQHRHCT